MRLQRTARIRAIRLPARRATIARILKVKISLGTPLRVYRESRSAAAPFARMKSESDFSEIDFAKARRGEARRGEVKAAVLGRTLLDDFVIRRWRSSQEVETRGRIEPSRMYRVTWTETGFAALTCAPYDRPLHSRSRNKDFSTDITE